MTFASVASLGPCFPKSQVCKPCSPHCQLTESGRCSYLPSTLADYGLVLQNQQCLEWICLGIHEGWNEGKWHGCSLKEEVFVVFWSCRLSHEIWFSNLFMVRHAMEGKSKFNDTTACLNASQGVIWSSASWSHVEMGKNNSSFAVSSSHGFLDQLLQKISLHACSTSTTTIRRMMIFMPSRLAYSLLRCSCFFWIDSTARSADCHCSIAVFGQQMPSFHAISLFWRPALIAWVEFTFGWNYFYRFYLDKWFFQVPHAAFDPFTVVRVQNL